MSMRLTARYTLALQTAMELHQEQARKCSGVPFLSHLMEVSSLVMSYGGSEDEAIAALLHDSIEDAGGAPTEQLIAERFGSEVAAMVRGVSDTDQTPKPPWRERKQQYLDHLMEASPSMLLISCADKLANVRALLSDYQQEGEELWSRFNAPKQDQLWVYEAYVRAFESRLPGPLTQELRTQWDRMRALAFTPQQGRTEAESFWRDPAGFQTPE